MQNIHDRYQPLDSRQLLAFVTLARTRNFTATGKELFLSQSAISHAIKALETDLDCRLIDRVGKKIQLTSVGEHLLYCAEKVLTDMSNTRAALERLTKWGRGRLRIAASESIRQYLLVPALSEFQKDFGEWAVSVEPADTRRCVELLRQNQTDLAIAIAPNRAEPVDVVPLFTDELMWIVPPEHPWARNGHVIAKEISTQRFILSHSTSYTFQLLVKYFQRDGTQPKSFMELGNLEAIKETVKRGLGVTVLAPWVVSKDLAEKSLVALPLGKRKLRRNWCALRSLEKKPSLAEETFLNSCREQVKTFSESLDLITQRSQ